MKDYTLRYREYNPRTGIDERCDIIVFAEVRHENLSVPDCEHVTKIQEDLGSEYKHHFINLLVYGGANDPNKQNIVDIVLEHNSSFIDMKKVLSDLECVRKRMRAGSLEELRKKMRVGRRY